MADVTGGSDGIDMTAGHATCIRMFQITGGTGRFVDASSNNLTLTMTVVPVLANNPVFFSVTGAITGTASRVAAEEQP